MSLEALERSDLSRLPGGIFTRAFIRAYAQEVGLDPDRMIQEFIAELPPEAATATRHSPAFEDGDKLDSDRRAAATAIRLALISLPIIGLVVYFGMRRPPPASPHQMDPVSDTPAARPEPAAVPAAATGHAGGGAVVAESMGLTMEVMPRASCWVSATVDGDPLFAELMNPGDKRVIHAREQILLNVGDAGAFAYTLNGRDGRALGAPGEIVSTRITVANAHEFLNP
jgi:cytoskeletal protein RodZ